MEKFKIVKTDLMTLVPNSNEIREREDGSLECRQCRGDWYGCDCPRLPKES